MPTYRLTLEYDGTDFLGWQVQPHHRTVAGELHAAFVSVTGEQPSVTAAGRTDAGAHAHGQVVGVTLQHTWDPERLRAALNSVLPADVAVVAATARGAGFDARRDALDRTYRYVVLARTGPAPITRRHTWVVSGPLAVDAMREAAAHLVGTHDYAAFGGPTNPGGSTVRTVHEITVTRELWGAEPDGPALDAAIISVRANAFLRGMMRAFAGALVKVGQGRMRPAWVAQLVAAPVARSSTIPLAPARGLHQWSVTYAPYPVTSQAA